MSTLADLKSHVKSKYSVKSEDDEGFSVLVEFDGGRTQLVGVHRFTAMETAFVELRSYVCKENEMSAKVALQKNDDFILGGLALDSDGDVCFLYSAPLRTLTPPELDLALEIVAKSADKLEKTFSGTDTH
jgi:hypothetical protein